jgi:hypothetical protein
MATPERTVRRRRRVAPDIALPVQEYLQNRSMRERSSYHETDIKARLMEILATVGQPDGDEGQHRKLLLDEPIEFTTYKAGRAKVTVVTGIQRQERKGSMTLNEDRTMAYLTKRRLLPSCTTTVTVINEDAILAANFEGTIPDDDLKTLYDESDPSYAFYLIEE